MANQSILRCANCGAINITIGQTPAIIHFNLLLITSTGSLSLKCTSCNRLVSVNYGDRGWPLLRAYRFAIKLFMTPRKRISPSRWPKHLHTFAPGEQNE